MKRLNQWLMIGGLAVGLSAGAGSLLAQDNAQRGNRQGRGNFDPAQMQQRMMDRAKEQLEITDETEWKAVQPLLQKVMDARVQAMSGMGRGMFGRGPRPGGDDAARPGADSAQGSGDQARRRSPGAASAEAEALQKAIDAKASSAELKAAIAKCVEVRKARQADLEKAQAELRKVLSVRQEAIATSAGWL